MEGLKTLTTGPQIWYLQPEILPALVQGCERRCGEKDLLLKAQPYLRRVILFMTWVHYNLQLPSAATLMDERKDFWAGL